MSGSGNGACCWLESNPPFFDFILGEYPIESVRMQHLIAREAEPAIYHRQLFEDLQSVGKFV